MGYLECSRLYFYETRGLSDPVIFPSPELFVAYFSPQDPLYPHLIYLISEVKDSIYAAFYKIELKKLSCALLQAHQRGTKVKIFTDDLTFQGKDSESDYLAKFGLIKKDHDPESVMHHKFCIIDEEIAVTGSKFSKHKFFLIPSLMVNLPDHWQDNFVRANGLKCLSL
jgi:phosphatidylserine/phosphatidylglycerophosphate/cardiolipin synthase-like enzyme